MLLLQSDAASGAGVLVLGLIAFALYFLPAIIGRKKRAANAIFILNLLLGTTGVFWIIALVWALTPDAQPVVIHHHGSARATDATPISTVTPQRRMWPAVTAAIIAWTVILGVAGYGWQQGWLDQSSDKNPSQAPTDNSALVLTPTVTPVIKQSPTPSATPTVEAATTQLTEATPTPTPRKTCIENGVKVPCP